MAGKIKLATNIQLMEWLAKGKGIMKADPFEPNPKCMTLIVESVHYTEGRHFCYESDLNKPVSGRIRIRRWDDPHWRLPLVNYINKDLKETT